MLKKSTHPIIEFAEHHDLVVFGDINDKDELDKTRGLSYVGNPKDTHYAHGNVEGYELTVFERAVSGKAINSSRKELRLFVCKATLENIDLPHLVIVGSTSSVELLQHTFAVNPNLRPINMPGLENTQIKVYGEPQRVHEIGPLLSPAIQYLTQMNNDNIIELKQDTVSLITERIPENNHHVTQLANLVLAMTHTVVNV